MSIGFIFLGLAPLVIFAILDSFFSLKAGLIGAIIAIAIEAAMSFYFIGELDSFTLYNILLVIVFALLAWKFNSSKYFKLQPSLISLVFGSFLVGSYLLDQPILSEFLIKYKGQLSESLSEQPLLLQRIQHPSMIKMFREATFTIGVLHFFHAGITAFAAVKLGNFLWLLSRVSIYIFLFIGVIWAQMRII